MVAVLLLCFCVFRLGVTVPAPPRPVPIDGGQDPNPLEPTYIPGGQLPAPTPPATPPDSPIVPDVPILPEEDWPFFIMNCDADDLVETLVFLGTLTGIDNVDEKSDAIINLAQNAIDLINADKISCATIPLSLLQSYLNDFMLPPTITTEDQNNFTSPYTFKQFLGLNIIPQHALGIEESDVNPLDPDAADRWYFSWASPFADVDKRKVLRRGLNQEDFTDADEVDSFWEFKFAIQGADDILELGYKVLKVKVIRSDQGMGNNYNTIVFLDSAARKDKIQSNTQALDQKFGALVDFDFDYGGPGTGTSTPDPTDTYDKDTFIFPGESAANSPLTNDQFVQYHAELVIAQDPLTPTYKFITPVKDSDTIQIVEPRYGSLANPGYGDQEAGVIVGQGGNPDLPITLGKSVVPTIQVYINPLSYPTHLRMAYAAQYPDSIWSKMIRWTNDDSAADLDESQSQPNSFVKLISPLQERPRLMIQIQFNKNPIHLFAMQGTKNVVNANYDDTDVLKYWGQSIPNWIQLIRDDAFTFSYNDEVHNLTVRVPQESLGEPLPFNAQNYVN